VRGLVWAGVETRVAVGKERQQSTPPPRSKSPQVGAGERGCGVYPQFHTLYGYY